MFIVCIALQLFLLPALVLFVGAAWHAIELLPTGDPQQVAGAFSAGVVSSVLMVGPALLGAIISWFLIRGHSTIPGWFARTARVLSWLWLVFLPLGTLFGAVQLSLLRNAKREGRIAARATAVD